MIGSGIGGVAMGWWMDKRGIMSPVLFGSAMLICGALLASQAQGQTSLYIANGVLIGLLGKAAMIAPLMANATKWFDRRRGLAIAILASGQGLSGLLWLPLIGMLSASVGCGTPCNGTLPDDVSTRSATPGPTNHSADSRTHEHDTNPGANIGAAAMRAYVDRRDRCCTGMSIRSCT